MGGIPSYSVFILVYSLHTHKTFKMCMVTDCSSLIPELQNYIGS
jgi:hypothetical protein